MRLLVTGGAGFIGCNFVRHMLDSHSDYKVTILDKLTCVGMQENILDISEDIIEHIEDRLGHNFRYSIDSSKIRMLGWKPNLNFDNALSYAIDWYLENKAWWCEF